MGLTVGQLVSGAGGVGSAWRQEEDAQRVSRQNQLKIEEQNRLNRFRQNELQAQIPTQPTINIDQFGQSMGIETITPVAPTELVAPIVPPLQADDSASVQANVPPPTAVDANGVWHPVPIVPARPTMDPKEIERMRKDIPKVGPLGQTVIDGTRKLQGLIYPESLPPGVYRANANDRVWVPAPTIGDTVVKPTMDPKEVDRMRSSIGLKKPAKVQTSSEKKLEELKVRSYTLPTQPAADKPKDNSGVLKILTTEVRTYLSALEQQNGIPQGVLASVMEQESKGKPGLTSKAGAQGYFQFMPETAAQYGVKVNDFGSEATGAAKFIGELFRKYNGDMTKVLAAYNWGQGNVDNKGVDKAPKETRNYIPQVLARLNPVSSAQAAPTPTIVQPVAAKVGETVAPKEQKKISDFYMANPNAVTEDMAKATRQRDELVRLAKSYQNAGMGLNYSDVRAKIMEMDEGMFYLQGMQGLSDLALAKDPRRLQAVWSRAKGQPIGIQPRSDGMYNVFLNGNKLEDPYSLADVSEAARSSFDSAYVKQVTDMAIERSNKRFDSQIKIGEILTEENAKMLREVTVEGVKGANAIRQEWAKASATMDIKPLGDGETVLFRQAGSNQVYMYNKSGRTVEIDGVKITSHSAVPITGMPTLEKLAR